MTKFRLGTLTKEEYKERLKEATPVYEALWPREIKTVSTAVEVLRQAEYPDWKLYSRYNSSGIGDLLMQEENMIVSPNRRYTLAKSEARVFVTNLGFRFFFRQHTWDIRRVETFLAYRPESG